MVLIRIVGLIDESDQQAVETALRTADPSAGIRIDRGAGLAEVNSSTDTQRLCDAIQQAGFIAVPLARRPGLVGGRDVMRLFGRAVGFALLGLVGGAILGIGIGILNVVVNPECHSATDEGACAMGIPMIGVGMAMLCATVTAAVTFIRGFARLYRQAHSAP